MNYHDAWLTLIFQRDQTYFYLVIAAATGLMWYRFAFYRYFWPALAGWLLLVCGGIVWGGLQLMGG